MTVADLPSTPTSAGLTDVHGTGGQKGLKTGALGLASTVVIGVASVAPAYSLAATLGFVVAFVGVQSPIVVILAFVPMLFIAIGYQELNKADPDCGTTFTWATRAFGPKTGWMGGWGIIAADLLVMASLAQIAGQYAFLLFNVNSIGANPTSGWVLLVGVGWIAVMTWICYRGVELSAALQKFFLVIELFVLVVFAGTALVKVAIGSAGPQAINPSWSWLNPFEIDSFSSFVRGVILMLFIYWGWDSAVSVNEETADPEKTPGRAAVISTVTLVVTYVLLVLSSQSFAGTGSTGIGLNNSDNNSDIFNSLGRAVFGSAAYGSVMVHLLLFLVLTSAAASTQTTILPTARTTLSMAVYRALPKAFATVHRKNLTPTVSTLTFGGVSILLYVILNSSGNPGSVISDTVTALGMMIAFYYGLTGFACAWYYRHELTNSPRSFVFQGLLPFLGGVILFFALGWSVRDGWLTPSDFSSSYTGWHMSFAPHWYIGGVFLIGVGTFLVGIVLMIVSRFVLPGFFRGETLNADTPTLVPDAS